MYVYRGQEQVNLHLAIQNNIEDGILMAFERWVGNSMRIRW
jgi:hypothetical protein